MNTKSKNTRAYPSMNEREERERERESVRARMSMNELEQYE
jgi:hypothetical protein